ncbi:MAG TPA: hypothetical protein VKW76_06855 [Candidatus Binatia bacterium]|nr:hypothetical protein [Candidatus Binatia bacterium]
MSSLTFRTVDDVCAGVDFTPSRPVIDLSGITFVEPFGLIYLGMFLRHHNARGRAFDVTLPRDQAVRDYLARQHFWERFNFDPHSLPPTRLRRMRSTTSLDDIVDIERRADVAEEIAGAVLDLLTYNAVPVDLGAVVEIVSELVDNFALHAQGPLAAVTMQLYRGSFYGAPPRFVLAVGDCGIGIRASLATAPQYRYLAECSHHEAVAKAFEPMVSRRPDAGTGLTEVRHSTRRLQGTLCLASGDGYVRLAKGGLYTGRMGYDLPGVQIEVSIPMARR